MDASTLHVQVLVQVQVQVQVQDGHAPHKVVVVVVAPPSFVMGEAPVVVMLLQKDTRLVAHRNIAKVDNPTRMPCIQRATQTRSQMHVMSH